MDDLTYGQLTVYACPDEQLAALRDAIRDDGLVTHVAARADASRPWGAAPPPKALLDGVMLGDPSYFHEEVPVGWMRDRDFAARLIEVASGASWKAWEAPQPEHLGTVVMYTPELGRFEATCDPEGSVVADYQTLRHRINKNGLTYAEALGEPWETAFEALQSAMPGTWPNQGHVAPIPGPDDSGRPDGLTEEDIVDAYISAGLMLDDTDEGEPWDPTPGEAPAEE